jgi:hypothetical protein
LRASGMQGLHRIACPSVAVAQDHPCPPACRFEDDEFFFVSGQDAAAAWVEKRVSVENAASLNGEKSEGVGCGFTATAAQPTYRRREIRSAPDLGRSVFSPTEGQILRLRRVRSSRRRVAEQVDGVEFDEVPDRPGDRGRPARCAAPSEAASGASVARVEAFGDSIMKKRVNRTSDATGSYQRRRGASLAGYVAKVSSTSRASVPSVTLPSLDAQDAHHLSMDASAGSSAHPHPGDPHSSFVRRFAQPLAGARVAGHAMRAMPPAPRPSRQHG